jgi:hypothetical protein
MAQTLEGIPQLVEDYVTFFKEKTGIQMKLVNKDSSTLMKLIGWFIKSFQPNFMDRYITTLGNTVYIPQSTVNNLGDLNLLEIIGHESVHARDANKYGKIKFGFLYLFPQSLALLALGAISGIVLGPLALIFLIFLFSLLPIPAPWRYKFELKAYRTSLLFATRVHNAGPEHLQAIKNWIVEQLSGKPYYCCWPKRFVMSDLDKELSAENDPDLDVITDFLQAKGLLR